MKYFYFIILILLISFFFILSNINTEIIVLDLFFVKIEGISLGYSIVFSIFIGAVISFILQLPRLFGRNTKVLSDRKDENP
tara:strand:+ start:1351 stop:1593 length:243 start_codon:yes stop_codon:yes gene_type:complete